MGGSPDLRVQVGGTIADGGRLTGTLNPGF